MAKLSHLYCSVENTKEQPLSQDKVVGDPYHKEGEGQFKWYKGNKRNLRRQALSLKRQ